MLMDILYITSYQGPLGMDQCLTDVLNRICSPHGESDLMIYDRCSNGVFCCLFESSAEGLNVYLGLKCSELIYLICKHE